MVWAGGRYPPSIFYIYAWHSWHWSFRFFSIIAILILTWDVFLQLYVHGEKFNQPIFHCNNIAGHVDPVSRIDLLYTFSGEVWLPSCQFQVVPDNEHRALYSTHSFKILFKEGGCGTFVPLFFNLISSVRQYNQRTSMEAQPQMDPLQAASTPVDEMMRHAYVSISLFIFHDYKDYICLIYIYYHYLFIVIILFFFMCFADMLIRMTQQEFFCSSQLRNLSWGVAHTIHMLLKAQYDHGHTISTCLNMYLNEQNKVMGMLNLFPRLL